MVSSDLGAERRLGDRDREVGDDVVALASERLVRRHPNVHVQIAGTAATGPDGAATGESQGRASVDTRWHIDLIGLRGDDPTLAGAGTARSDDDLTEAATPRARTGRDHLAEHALTHTLHLAAAVALRAGDRLGSRPSSRTTALLAAQRSAHLDRDSCAEDGVGKCDVGDNLEILATRWTGWAAASATTEGTASAAEEGVEQIAESTAVEHVAEVRSTRRGTDSRLTEAVVSGPSVSVAEHLVCLSNLFEALLGCGVAGVGVGVQLAGPLAVGLLDLVGAGRARHAEQVVVVRHYAAPSPSRLARRSLTTSTVANACG